MFAVRIRHPVTDAALAGEREQFDEAMARWCGWLEQQPGFITVVVLDEGGGEISAMSLWVDQDAFATALSDPDVMTYGGPLGAFFTAPSSPEAVPVLYFGVGG